MFQNIKIIIFIITSIMLYYIIDYILVNTIGLTRYFFLLLFLLIMSIEIHIINNIILSLKYQYEIYIDIDHNN
jgi:hypothetical protein